MLDCTMMTAQSFMQSYDRDILDLQDDPMSYISELEADMERAFPMSVSFDINGSKVWPLILLKQMTGVTTGEPLWPENTDHLI